MVYCWAVCLLEASFYVVVLLLVHLKYFMIGFSFVHDQYKGTSTFMGTQTYFFCLFSVFRSFN